LRVDTTSTWPIVAVAFLLTFVNPSTLFAQAGTTFKVSEFTFTRPANWESVEVTSQMRKAQFKIADAKTKGVADVIFFHFGAGDGGGTKANVDRWFGQFKEPRDQIKAKTEEATIGGHKVTYVQAEGTYLSGMPGGPQTPMPGYALAGAIIESAQGSVFIRMTGPQALVKDSLADFKKMVESATAKTGAANTTFQVILASFPADKKISVVKALREIKTGIGLAEAKTLAEAAPTPVLQSASKTEADTAKTKLEEAGANVEIR
jgi:ribosomal protein L7/L12